MLLQLVIRLFGEFFFFIVRWFWEGGGVIGVFFEMPVAEMLPEKASGKNININNNKNYYYKFLLLNKNLRTFEFFYLAIIFIGLIQGCFGHKIAGMFILIYFFFYKFTPK